MWEFYSELILNVDKELFQPLVKVGQFLNLVIFLDNFAVYCLSEIRVFDKIGTP